MTTLKDFIGGLQILAQYADDKDGVCAEHDIVYAGHNKPVSEADAARLRALGWHWDDDVDSWAIFV